LVGASVAWLVGIGEDFRLLAMEYLPEFLLVSLLLLLSWGVRRGFRRDARSSL
jgi:hypothetical protein